MLCTEWFIVLVCVGVTTAKPLKKPKEYPEWEKDTNEDLIGDMKLTPSQKIETGILPANADVRVTRKSTKGHLWVGGIVPYVIDSSLLSNSAAATAIQTAMDMWSQHTDYCITFVPRTSETDYVTLTSKNGCWANVGRVGGEQFISLTNDGGDGPHCWHAYVAAHEIGHALGFYHEHSRPDRDSYVVIHPENVVSGQELSFKKYSSDVINTHSLPYNYQSIMHYTKTAFSKNEQETITPVVSHANEILGNTVGPNELDYNQMKLMYKCSGSTSGVTAAPPYKAPAPDARSKLQTGRRLLQVRSKPRLEHTMYVNLDRSVNSNDSSSFVNVCSVKHDNKETFRKIVLANCTDGFSTCPWWAYNNECTRNPEWMNQNCKKSCKQCPGTKSYCPDDKHGCFEWMSQGECETNPSYMLAYCKTSCKHDSCP